MSAPELPPLAGLSAPDLRWLCVEYEVELPPRIAPTQRQRYYDQLVINFNRARQDVSQQHPQQQAEHVVAPPAEAPVPQVAAVVNNNRRRGRPRNPPPPSPPQPVPSPIQQPHHDQQQQQQPNDDAPAADAGGDDPQQQQQEPSRKRRRHKPSDIPFSLAINVEGEFTTTFAGNCNIEVTAQRRHKKSFRFGESNAAPGDGQAQGSNAEPLNVEAAVDADDVGDNQADAEVDIADSRHTV